MVRTCKYDRRAILRAKGDKTMVLGEGGIRSSITVHLSFWDRVRLLFGARMVVYLATRVEKDPGRLMSEESHVVIGREPPFHTSAESPAR